MCQEQTGCMVSSPMHGNSATDGFSSATAIATSDATSDLLVAAKRVLGRHKCNHTRNQHATGQLQAAAISSVARLHGPMQCNYATQAMRDLVVTVSNAFGGDDPAFLDDYCDELIRKNASDLTTVIEILRDLAGGSHLLNGN